MLKGYGVWVCAFCEWESLGEHRIVFLIIAAELKCSAWNKIDQYV